MRSMSKGLLTGAWVTETQLNLRNIPQPSSGATHKSVFPEVPWPSGGCPGLAGKSPLPDKCFCLSNSKAVNHTVLKEFPEICSFCLLIS